jgi:hypothetical protein
MPSSVSGQNDLWAQLAAIQSAQSASAFGQGGTSPATAATTPPPMLSSGLLSQLLSLGGVFGGGADGTSGITQGSGSSGVAFPIGPRRSRHLGRRTLKQVPAASPISADRGGNGAAQPGSAIGAPCQAG